MLLVGCITPSAIAQSSSSSLAPGARPLTDAVFKVTPERLERGSYLAEGPLACILCHSKRDKMLPGWPIVKGTEGAGQVIFENGDTVLASPNLTPDEESGVGTWTDDMLARAIREGVGHDGRALSRFMPYTGYQYLSDEDLKSIVVFLRSLNPVRHEVPRTRIGESKKDSWGPRRIRIGAPVAHPDMSDLLTRGIYLVKAADCRSCHTTQQPRSPGNFGGGDIYHEDTESPVFSGNITSHNSGVGSLTPEAFASIIRTGKGGTLDGEMPWQAYKNSTDEDLAAMLHFLKTTYPINHTVLNRVSPSFCEVCGQRHGLGEINPIPQLESFDSSYVIPWDIAGSYTQLGGRSQFDISKIEDQWMISANWLKPSPIMAASETTFHALNLNRYFHFEFDKTGEVTGFQVTTGLDVGRFKRAKK